MKNERKKQLYQVLKETSTSLVEVGDWNYCIAFDTNNTDQEDTKESFQTNKKPIPLLLQIKDASQFELAMDQYINAMELFLNQYPQLWKYDNVYYEGNKTLQEKFMMATVWCNASPEDFQNPIAFLKRRIDFLENGHETNKKELDISDCFQEEDLKLVYGIELQHPILETPFCFQSSIQNSMGDTYHLPKISFGISQGKCFIYAIQDKEDHQRKDPFYKKVKRLLYKVGNHVQDDYYAEKITDVSPSFLCALSCFLGAMEKEKITDFEVVPYLPVRYQAKIIGEQKKQQLFPFPLDKQENIYEKADALQENITNRFIRTFMRLAYHFDSIEVVSYPGDIDNSLHFKVNPLKKIQNTSIVTEISKKVLAPSLTNEGKKLL